MNGGIYLIQDDGHLVEMTGQRYDSEDLLQGLLAEYPSLLAGDQIDPAAPRRWLLISREMPLPSEEQGGERWSVDHLFLDQDAIPTLVEVKRSGDTRIRREVVGQMLDYAANGVVYWPLEKIRAQFEANCKVRSRDPEEVLRAFLGPDADSEEFWQKVRTNLQAGKVRLVFVADEIPTELQRVVEFLNEQMDPAEVLAIEIRQFGGHGLKALVPRVIGQTAEAQRRKRSSQEGKQWDEPSFFQELQSKRGVDDAKVGRRILAWAQTKALRVSWGKGRIYGSWSALLDHGSTTHSLLTLWTSGTVQVPFQMMQARSPFDDDVKRLELRRRLNEIPGVHIPEDAVTRYPNIALAALKAESALEQFLAAFDWAVQVIQVS